MKNLYGKFFKNTKSGKYECFLYNLEQDYNKLIQNILEKGYQEVSFSLFKMMELAKCLVMNEGLKATRISFVFEDDEWENEVNRVLKNFNNGEADWDLLEVVVTDGGLNEIRDIHFKSKENEFLLTVKNNGIFFVSEDAYNLVSKMICDILNENL